MITRVDMSEKLGIDKFNINEGCPHIIIDAQYADDHELEKLVKACPAALYDRNEDGSIKFDFAGCLECGTCRVLCGETIVQNWEHPEGTFGVEFRYG